MSVLFYLSGFAFAHGGEDHAEVSAAAPVDAMTTVSMSSPEFDAVLRFGDGDAGVPVPARLLLADFATSAPIPEGEATLSLTGAGAASASLHSDAAHPGTWPFEITFPVDGIYHGGLSILAGDRADLLTVPDIDRAHHHTGVATGFDWGALGLGLGLGLAIAVVGLGVGAGVRRMLPAALLVGAAAAGGRVYAHGGEDHGEATLGAVATGDVIHLSMESQFLLGVRTTPSRTGPFEETVSALGRVTSPPGGIAEIHAPVTGVLAFPTLLTPGDAVTAGQRLATIAQSLDAAASGDVASARSDAQVRLAEARKTLTLARQDAERAAGLTGVLSERDQTERRLAVKVAEQRVRAIEAETRSLGTTGASTALTSPIAGRISALNARPGDVVSPGDVLFRIVGAGGLWVEGRVPESLAGRLAVGGAARVTADARPDAPISGTVLDAGLEVDTTTGTLPVTVALAETPAWLRPGMTVSASVALGESRDALVIPDGAVVDSGGESIVFVKVGPESFVVRPIRSGALSGDLREVRAGLSADERVVTIGTYTLRSLAGR